MTAPSGPLLDWLRKVLQQRGMNSAQLATMVNLPRGRVRKILVGAEPMLVDELLQITQALEVTPQDLGAAQDASEPSPPEVDTGATRSEPRVDPWGNQPRQLIQIGFALGCDFGFVVDTRQVEGSGLPRTVLEQYQGNPMRIQLDAAYHRYNDPSYNDDGLTLTLSFDALYVCTFPWSAIRQVLFTPVAPEAPAQEPPEPAGRPHLRLVT